MSKKTSSPVKMTPQLDYFSWELAKREFLLLAGERYNAAYTSVTSPSKTALFWEGENGQEKTLTFAQVETLSNQFAAYLKSMGLAKGERVFFFLPRVPEIYFGVIGALKAGAVVGTLFPAFGADALLERLGNAGAKMVITNQELNQRLTAIKEKLPELKQIIEVENLESILAGFPPEFEPEKMKPGDPAMMLYTSATGNTPVCGIVIPHQAIVQQRLTGQWVLDLKAEDIYWCTADPGWVTGLVYGLVVPWSLGITQVVFEGRFDIGRWYKIIQKYRVSVWYTAPTALRMLAKDENLTKKYNFSSLRHVCCVGEPLTPASIEWSLKTWKLLIHDTWWQTETGAMMIANLPEMGIKPGSMGKPLPGIKAKIIDENGRELPPDQVGRLVFEPGWPSMMIEVWRHHERYQSYFKNGWYDSGDRAKKDGDGYFWFVGRGDDVIKTSGERVAPFDVEACLMEHPAVLEVGVIGKPDSLRGEIIKAFIVLKPNYTAGEKLADQLKEHVKSRLAGHAYPREISFVSSLPKNRAGKIVRRILKAREMGLPEGETSTLSTDEST